VYIKIKRREEPAHLSSHVLGA